MSSRGGLAGWLAVYMDGYVGALAAGWSLRVNGPVVKGMDC